MSETKMRRLFLSWLDELGACRPQYEAAADLAEVDVEGNDYVPVTVELCVAHADAFDWGWAAEKLLSEAAQASYDGAVDHVYRAYWEEVHKASDRFQAAIRPHLDAHDAALRRADDAYFAVFDAHRGRRWTTSALMAAAHDRREANRAAFREYDERTADAADRLDAEREAARKKLRLTQARAWAEAFLSDEAYVPVEVSGHA